MSLFVGYIITSLLLIERITARYYIHVYTSYTNHNYYSYDEYSFRNTYASVHNSVGAPVIAIVVSLCCCCFICAMVYRCLAK